MENKNLKKGNLHIQSLLVNKEDKHAKSDSFFDDELLKTTNKSWWTKLLFKIFLPHKNKLVDKLLDLGCFSMLFIVVVGIVYVFMWMFDFIKIFD